MMAVITSVLVQKETGGNLAEIFDQISRVIRSRFRFGRKVRTLSAEGRMSAWILTLTPIVLFAIIWITSPSYLPRAHRSSPGPEALMFAGFMGVVGILWMRKIIRIEVKTWTTWWPLPDYASDVAVQRAMIVGRAPGSAFLFIIGIFSAGPGR